ncbi:hypothetical protein LFM09_08120 [Lentzea alba]|uniref:hypothetical protein n=1 Tax=Lentzea alba TaxID=2714351 RepID=UPI0039BEED83
MLTSAVAAPQAAAAAACQVEDLPVPAGAFEARTRGTSDNGLIVGEVQHDGIRGVVWANGQPSEMAAPANPNVTSVRPSDINNHGSVVGTQETFGSGETVNRAFIYRDGVYYLLYTEGPEQSRAVGVNDNGDVIGEVWLKSAPQTRWVALWPAGQPRRLYVKGQAIGISADRKLVLATATDKTWVIDGNTGAWTPMPGARTPMTLDNERILHFEFTPTGTQIAEWNLTGQRVDAYAEGRDVYGKNAAGVLFGVSTHGETSVWSGGTRKEIVADKLPHFSYAADILDDGTMIGTYEGSQSGLPHAARWTCS